MRNKYASKMRYLMARPGRFAEGRKPSVLNEADILRSEERLGARLPSDYREFVTEFGGFLVPFATFLVEEDGGKWNANIEVFSRINEEGNNEHDLVDSYLWAKEEYPEELGELISIGRDAGGSSIMLKISGANRGQIVLMTSNLESFKIADNFDSFMNLLQNSEEPVSARESSEEYWKDHLADELN